MKIFVIGTICFFLFGIRFCFPKKETIQNEVETIYQFEVKNLQGEVFNFSSLKGKKVMIVNTASKCGLTPQYEGLQKLYETYKDKDFVIIGFPSNDFLFQEPGSSLEIAEFCKLNYGVTFPMMGKVKVKGSKQHPVYEYLTNKNKNGFKDSRVRWNFQKYLINEKGFLEKVISPKTKPNSTEILEWLES